ncbi:hypothetical protein [Actinomadura sp. KC216]|uniref:hypothetical protein n=1 Tax=Actinomadura sp. KC216 TaxID=2530370 RepID=UPI001A9CD844|nr:hypothetical protein [Actinomadura sp. KC216]
MSILTGRDGELEMILLGGYTGMRWAELVGPRLGSVRVEWQLWEDDDGILHRIPPKDDSYRTAELPPWLSELVLDQIARTAPEAVAVPRAPLRLPQPAAGSRARRECGGGGRRPAYGA